MHKSRNSRLPGACNFYDASPLLFTNHKCMDSMSQHKTPVFIQLFTATCFGYNCQPSLGLFNADTGKIYCSNTDVSLFTSKIYYKCIRPSKYIRNMMNLQPWNACIYIFPPTHPQWRCGPTRARASSFLRFLDHTQRRITVRRTPLDEWSARPRDLYLITHNTHNRQTSMPPVGFEPTISAGERLQTYALDRAATGTGI